MRSILAVHIINNRYLSRQDSDFVDIVLSDLSDYLQEATVDRVFLFPALQNRYRFLIHKIIEDHFPNFASFSVGEGNKRRSVVCLLESLERGLKGQELLMSGLQIHASKGRGRGWISDRESPSPSDSPHRPWEEVEQYTYDKATQNRNKSAVLKNDDNATQQTERQQARFASRGRARSKKPEQQLYVPRGRREQGQPTPGGIQAAADKLFLGQQDTQTRSNNSQPSEGLGADRSQFEDACPAQPQDYEAQLSQQHHKHYTPMPQCSEGPQTMDTNAEMAAGKNEAKSRKPVLTSKQGRAGAQIYVPRGRRKLNEEQSVGSQRTMSSSHSPEGKNVVCDLGGKQKSSENEEIADDWESEYDRSNPLKSAGCAQSPVQQHAEHNTQVLDSSVNIVDFRYTVPQLDVNYAQDILPCTSLSERTTSEANQTPTAGSISDVNTTDQSLMVAASNQQESIEGMDLGDSVLASELLSASEILSSDSAACGTPATCGNVSPSTSYVEDEKGSLNAVNDIPGKISAAVTETYSVETGAITDLISAALPSDSVTASCLQKGCKHLKVTVCSSTCNMDTSKTSMPADSESSPANRELLMDTTAIVIPSNFIEEQSINTQVVTAPESESYNRSVDELNSGEQSNHNNKSQPQSANDDMNMKISGLPADCNTEQAVKLPVNETEHSENEEKQSSGTAEDIHDHTQADSGIQQCGSDSKIQHSSVLIEPTPESVTALKENVKLVAGGGDSPLRRESNTKGGSASLGGSGDNKTQEEEGEEEDSWDKIFDDNGDCLDPSALDELTAHVGKVEISGPKKEKIINYLDFQPKEPDVDTSAYGHVIEICDFPADFQTRDLLAVFKDYTSRGFDVKWVDDTHALGVFSSAIAAEDALKMKNPMMKVKPLSEASSQSRSKAKRSQEFLQPYKARPETSAVAARRLVSGALGLAPRVSKEQRDEERKKLKEAKDKKRQDKKQKEAIWEGTL